MDDMGAGFGPHIVHGGRIDNILVVLGADIRDGRSITSKTDNGISLQIPGFRKDQRVLERVLEDTSCR